MASLDDNPRDGSFDLVPWKKVVGTVVAVLLAFLFVVSGGWKLAAPFTWAQLVGQLRVPAQFALPLAILSGVGEVFCGVLIFVPRFRRWGSLLMSLMLVGFMVYFAINYNALVGKDCSCFPLVKRTVGPMFFVVDALLLAAAVLAGWWARRASGVREALIILAAVCVFAGVSFGVNKARENAIRTPATVVVDGKPYSLRQGRVFLFFYNPSCLHCDAAARRMSKLAWNDTAVVAIPTEGQEWAAAFLHDTGLKAVTTLDAKKLREVFQFVDPPYGVALDNGRPKAVVATFDDSEPARTLRSIGYVQ
ncbi:MAG: MauE/DoxX family redox-associated membrane protein [Bryobacteraceae bacterium]|jgi:uncharacterized membrane protein YphA (DoxX/SURF4 family)/thiol-disulfide isomerase/thioredoxin